MVDERKLAALGEKYSVDILRMTAEPRSARELSERVDIPIATCYRRIEDLVDAGLLIEEGRELSDKGRRTSVYRRAIEDLSISFDDEDVDVSTVEREPLRQNLPESTRSTERG